MITVVVTPARRVTCRATLDLPLAAPVAWGQLRDFRRFAAQDFFHAAVRVAPPGVRPGAPLEIDHRFGPFRATRVGRILQWREHHGYSFSDLSPRGPRRAFPHVYRYRLRPTRPGHCSLEITIAGLWTTYLVPRPLARLWLRWVFSHIVRRVECELLAASPSPNSASGAQAPDDAPPASAGTTAHTVPPTGPTVPPRYDGFYRSGLVRRVEWHAGVEMTDFYFESIRFFPDGFFIEKHHPEEAFDFDAFLAGLDLDAIKKNYPQEDPRDAEYDPVYRTGRFEVAPGRVTMIAGGWSLLSDTRHWEEGRWELRLVSPELLEMPELGISYRFMPR